MGFNSGFKGLIKRGVNESVGVKYFRQVNKLKLYSANTNVGIKGTY